MRRPRSTLATRSPEIEIVQLHCQIADGEALMAAMLAELERRRESAPDDEREAIEKMLKEYGPWRGRGG
jgi:hypothetical protein